MPGVAFHPPPDVIQHLSGSGASRRARELVDQCLPDEELAGRRDEAKLAISELVSNAITAAGNCTVSIWYLPIARAVRVEVHDTGQGLPELQAFDPGRIGGHGLRIVDNVSTAWGVTTLKNGKIVWFEILDISD